MITGKEKCNCERRGSSEWSRGRREIERERRSGDIEYERGRDRRGGREAH